MDHITFLSTNKPICFSPKTLGYDAVVYRYLDDPCKTCTSLLVAFNEKNYREELSLPIISPPPANREMTFEAGIAIGAIVATILWLTIFSIITMLNS